MTELKKNLGRIFHQGIGRYLSEDELTKMDRFRIGIAGAGGLGSNCAALLVRCGFSDFVIADHDRVSASNLNRQFFFPDQVDMPKVEALKENMLKINPEIQVHTGFFKLDASRATELFGDCGAVIEALDTVSAKKMLMESFMGSQKFLVGASGFSGWGKSDQIITRKIRENVYIVGDFNSEATDFCPPVAPRVSITAAKQVDLILAYILGERGSDESLGGGR